MAPRPRRSAATKASESISVHAKWADTSDRSERPSAMSSRRSGRASGASISRDDTGSGDDSQLSLTVKVAPTKLRQATRGGNRRSEPFEGGEIVHGKRNRGAKKSYVVDSSPDEDDDDEDAEVEEDKDDELDDLDEDAEGDEMDVDAEGDDVVADDGEGTPSGGATIRVATAPDTRPVARAAASRNIVQDDDDDDDSLSEPDDSDEEDQTMVLGDDTMNMEEDEDAEGEDVDAAADDEDAPGDELEAPEPEDEDAEGDELDSDDEGSQGEAPDLAKMTKRQRARFEEEPAEFMKLSDEVQAKKHFTAEELSMRRQEMARRRRNLSDKRNEEVKMETINKLLKKQAPKVSRKAGGPGAGGDDADSNKPSPVFVRWVSNKDGSVVGVPDQMLVGPVGSVFKPAAPSGQGKMVQEVV